MELELATFADLSSGVSPEQRMRDLMEEAQLAEQVGLDVFAIGGGNVPTSSSPPPSSPWRRSRRRPSASASPAR